MTHVHSAFVLTDQPDEVLAADRSVEVDENVWDQYVEEGADSVTRSSSATRRRSSFSRRFSRRSSFSASFQRGRRASRAVRDKVVSWVKEMRENDPVSWKPELAFTSWGMFGMFAVAVPRDYTSRRSRY